MYFIPDSQRNSYLKEISGLAKAVEKTHGIASIATAGDIHAVRSQLLDWVGYAIDSAIPDAKARMIKLQEKQAAIMAGEPGKAAGRLPSFRFSFLWPRRQNPWCSAPDADFVLTIESQTSITDLIKKNDTFRVRRLPDHCPVGLEFRLKSGSPRLSCRKAHGRSCFNKQWATRIEHREFVAGCKPCC